VTTNTIKLHADGKITCKTHRVYVDSRVFEEPSPQLSFLPDAPLHIVLFSTVKITMK
jgi:hypothetical protein